MFEINFNKESKSLLPAKNRKSKWVAFLGVLLTGIKWLYLKVQNARSRNLYDLKNRQHVRHLEGVLNDAFDMAFRRIRVVDAPVQYEPIYIFQEAEQKPVALFTDAENQPHSLNTDYEIEFEGIDFVVQIPYSIPYDAAKMQALIEKYKTPGMAYLIEETL